MFSMADMSLTNEVFILLQGNAALYIGTEMDRFTLEAGKFYNVRCSIWHTITLESDACAAILENDNTGAHNTVYYSSKKPEVSDNAMPHGVEKGNGR